MGAIYEARVATEFGTYRAFEVAGDTLAVTEDGVDGIIDYMRLDLNAPVSNAPETTVQALIEWVFEFRRGEQLMSAVLARRE